MSTPVKSAAQVEDLHEAHPRVRAKDWRSPLVKRLLKSSKYADGECDLNDSFRPAPGTEVAEDTLSLSWKGLNDDYGQAINTYQDPVITEFATLGLACILLTKRTGLQITEVTMRGDRADYWLGDRELLLEVSGLQHGQLDSLCDEKATQLLDNPYDKPGYVCVVVYEQPSARLWFYPQPNGEEGA
jgi:hypothetical protein